MKKFFILILAILLPLSAFEMSADGSPASFICKSFYVDNYTWNTRYVYI